ncbi:hypothetical protein ABLE94_02580 [Gordonia sp. VNK1]|uniref:hypothetical protein n=1 Tax=Gordonia oleivorans TaxID=3156618 RepID=UPI0032B4409E
MSTIRTNVTLDLPQHKRLRTLSAKYTTPASVLIRELLTYGLAKLRTDPELQAAVQAAVAAERNRRRGVGRKKGATS